MNSFYCLSIAALFLFLATVKARHNFTVTEAEQQKVNDNEKRLDELQFNLMSCKKRFQTIETKKKKQLDMAKWITNTLLDEDNAGCYLDEFLNICK